MDDDDWEKEVDEAEAEAVYNEEWDEEQDGDEVADDWDAEPVEKKVEVNNPRKLTAKQLKKKQEELERKGRKMTEEEREAEVARQKAAIQKSNELLIDDMFGGEDFGDDGDGADAVDGFDRDKVKQKANEDLFGGESDFEEEEKKEEEPEMKAFPVTNEAEVNEFAKYAAEKIKKAPGNKLVIKFLKELIKGATENLNMDDVKQVQKELNNVYNVKRVEHNQKKQKKKKPTLKVAKSSRNDFDLDDGDYGDDFF
mmetsp:Transcript_27341/g.66488  ORF Transcript_27341/g.66488 Transcript_27341/m.66488 type:complete len:254 (+) Transcript_27341:102-863(+)|eukprot:CAMPEP_0114525208 /NCGR_PEP_ID=MMETSP0109-20121206/22291_1 /TAXON_ID=29199 /ORGANISM="Chlorarachnion reptans, Strain CCCM449" /LENGTH=253 /DNA_ID=CAMNT_0001706753 /DNA_START=69 /DNA_END=830 /DNA_ORIENTATION=+